MTTKEQDWEELRRRCENCRACELHETRHRVVFGVGLRTSPILFVGESICCEHAPNELRKTPNK